MAFPNYQYPSYQAYYPQPMPDPIAQMRQNQMQQPIMQQTNPQQMQGQILQSIPPVSTQNNGIVWCQGEEGAKAYLTAPGASVMLMDSEKNTFYIKSSDQSGMPLPLRIFDYTERTSNSKSPAQIVQPAVDYVTREEFEALEARINSLSVKETPKGRKSQKEDVTNDAS